MESAVPNPADFVISPRQQGVRAKNKAQRQESKTYSEEERRQTRERIALSASKSPIDHSSLLTTGADTDAFFNIGGKTLEAHRAILNVRAPNIFVYANKKKTIKKATVTIDIDEKSNISRSALETLLKFCYSGNIQFFGLEVFEIVQLYYVAKVYDLPSLREICLVYLYFAVDNSNFFSALKEAERLGCDEAKLVCKDYAKYRFADIVVQKEGCLALGIELFHELASFVTLPQKEYKPLEIEPIINAIHNRTRDDFKRIYQENFHADTIFKVEESTVLCHSYVLCGHGGELKKLLANGRSNIELPGKYKDLSRSAFDALLRFLYYQSPDDINPLVARQLKTFAVDYGLVKLSDLCDAVIKSGINERSVISVLKIANDYQKKRSKDSSIAVGLETKCLEYIMTEFAKVDFQTLFAAEMADANMAVDILENVQHQIEVGLWRKLKQNNDQLVNLPLKMQSPPSHRDDPEHSIPSPKKVSAKIRNKVKARAVRRFNLGSGVGLTPTKPTDSQEGDTPKTPTPASPASSSTALEVKPLLGREGSVISDDGDDDSDEPDEKDDSSSSESSDAPEKAMSLPLLPVKPEQPSPSASTSTPPSESPQPATVKAVASNPPSDAEPAEPSLPPAQSGSAPAIAAPQLSAQTATSSSSSAPTPVTVAAPRMAARLVNGKWVTSSTATTASTPHPASQVTAPETPDSPSRKSLARTETQRLREQFEKEAQDQARSAAASQMRPRSPRQEGQY